MAYQFASGETEAAALRRCAREQLDVAISQLEDGLRSDPVTAVHEARKALKMERSLLRLGRGALGSSARRGLNARLREAGRRLSGARDSEVMGQALDRLAEHYAGQLPKPTWDAIRARLDEEAQSSRARLIGSGLTGEVVEELRALQREVEQWRLRGDRWSAIEPGLRREYARGRRALRRAEGRRTVESLHEWRKRAKDLWYHLRLLEPASPGILGGYAKEAHRLSELLGDDHDLAVLRDKLLGPGAGIAADLESVLTLIDHRRDQLQAEALVLGARLYAEQPKAFVKRMRRYAQSWRAQARLEQAAEPVRLRGRTAATSVT